MSTRPVITVIGATDVQGGGLVRAILDDPSRSFAVRAVTRHAGSAAAQVLAAAGAEVVPADLDDVASLEQAMQCTYGVFAVSDGPGLVPPERDRAQAGHVARAAHRVRARHVIWSTPRDGDEADASFFRDLPATLLRTSFEWDNLIHGGLGPQRADDGVLELVLPIGDRLLPGIAASDIGPCALGVFQRCGQFVGRTVGIAGEHLCCAAMAEALARAMGEPVRHVPMSLAAYARLARPDAASLAHEFHHQYDCNEEYCAARTVESTRELYPGLMNFEQWLEGNVESMAGH